MRVASEQASRTTLDWIALVGNGYGSIRLGTREIKLFNNKSSEERTSIRRRRFRFFGPLLLLLQNPLHPVSIRLAVEQHALSGQPITAGSSGLLRVPNGFYSAAFYTRVDH